MGGYGWRTLRLGRFWQSYLQPSAGRRPGANIGAPDASEDLEFLRLLHQQVGEAWQRHGELMTWVEQNARKFCRTCALGQGHHMEAPDG